MPNSNTGGKRQGAGFPHETKAQTMALLGQKAMQQDDADALPSHDVDIRNYPSLTPKQVTVALALVRGMMSYNEVCRKFHMDDETLRNWRKLPEFQQLILDVRNRLLNEPLFAFSPMVPKAIKKYEQALEQDDNLSLAVHVAQDVFDRQYGKPIVRSLSAGISDIHITFSEKPVDISKYVEVDVVDPE